MFASTKGGPLYPRNLLRHFRQALRAAGLPHVAFHALRHTFVTLSLEAGADARTVADIAGHSSVTITLGVYAHSRPDGRRAAVRAVADLLTCGSAVAPSGEETGGERATGGLGADALLSVPMRFLDALQRIAYNARARE